MTSVFGPDGRRLKKITLTGTTLYLGADVEVISHLVVAGDSAFAEPAACDRLVERL